MNPSATDEAVVQQQKLPLAWTDIVLVLLMAVISAITVAGNLVVLLSFVLDRAIRQPSNYFIASLAVSDLLIGLEGIPVYTYFLVNGQRWPFGAFLCDLWLSVDYACCLASIYTVLGITGDRYMSVRYPAAYRNWRTKRRVLLIIAGIWLCPSILFSVSIFGYGWFSGKGRILQEDECYVQFMTNAYLNMGMYISYYWSTLVLMLYLYYGIYTAAKQLASKSDQKQRRMALLAEMRAVTPSGPDGDDGQGKNDRNNNNNTEAHSVVGMSEAGATVDDSMESRPQRRVSVTRIFSLRNGRLFSLKNILAGDGRSTAGGVHKGAGNNAKVPTDKAEHRQRSVTLTTPVANNVSSSCYCGNDAAQSLTQTAEPVRPSATISDAKRSPEAVGEEEGTTTAFTPVLVGESEHFFPFIDESAATSLQEASTKEAPEEKMNVNNSSIRGITNPNDDNNNNNTTPLTSPSIPNNNSFHGVTVPELFSADANNNSLRYAHAEAPALDAVNQRAVDTAASPFTNPFRTVGLSLQLFVHQHRSSSAFPESFSPHSEAVRMDVQVERTNDERFDDVFGGVRRWLGAVGRWERLTLRAQRRQRQRRKSRAGLTAQQRKLSKSSHSRSENRARKALRTITVILGTFTLFWTPFYVLATVYGFCERCSSSAGFQALYTISYLLCYMNSPINPFCYAMANQQFKRAFKKILRGDLRRN
uniref:G-protein coupled receptors family 1 profile domain-containing protein n=1 Tax=Globodera rostochiensis TaxID=31243 RepID=A0A914I6G0_GLORO